MSLRSPRSGEEGRGPLSTLEVDPGAEVEIDYNEIMRSRGRLSTGVRRNNSLPPRTTLWVLVMLCLGSILLLLGLGQYYDSWFGEKEIDGAIGLSMIGLGSFMFIPGSYGSYILYGAWSRWDGFSYDNIPNYGD